MRRFITFLAIASLALVPAAARAQEPPAADHVAAGPLAAGSAAPAPFSLEPWSVGRDRGRPAPPPAASQRPGGGALVCNCEPLGAKVFLGGEYLGEAPVKKLEVPEGDYTLTLVKPGFETYSSTVTIKKDVTLTVEDKLAQASGLVVISTEPPGAEVVFDGEEAGTTPLTITSVSGGGHSVELSREYFEPASYELDLVRGDHARIDLLLRRRLLLIGIVEGEVDTEEFPAALDALVAARIKSIKGISAIPAGVGSLVSGLEERGLDPGSLKFLYDSKPRLELQDAATLFGIMERLDAEIALVAVLSETDEGTTIKLTLYCSAGDAGDAAVFTSPDGSWLAEKLDAYFGRWALQQAGKQTTIGARLIDTAGGGAEVLSVLPGLPAGKAGIIPGDIITEVDGRAIAVKNDAAGAFEPAGEHKVVIKRRERPMEVSVSSVDLPLEAPTDSGEYLYSLGLTEFSGILKYVRKRPDTKDVLSYAALNLGNVFAHYGRYEKAVESYLMVDTDAASGLCTGTALFRLAEAYENLELWNEAAAAYRKVVTLFPYATLGSAEGPYAAPLAEERLKKLHELGLVKERWWM